MSVLTREIENYIKHTLASNEDFSAEELKYMIREDFDAPINNAEHIKNFIEKEETQRDIETIRSAMEKRAKVTKQDLVNELISLKKQISSQIDDFKNDNKSRSMNEAVKNVLSTIELIGEVTDALKEKEAVNNNLVYIDSIEQNINQIVKKMPKSKKKELIKDMSDEVGIVVKKKQNE